MTPDTSFASFPLPAGSADCHVHVYGPYDRFPAVHGGKFSPLQATPVEALLALWDRMGIARGVIVHALAAGGDNEVTLDALKRHRDRLRGVAILKPEVSERRLDELSEAGFKGVRINLLRQDGKPVSSGGMSLDDLLALAPRLGARGWHVQLWVETGDLKELAPTLEKMPFDFVIDHMGRTMADKGVDTPGFRWFCERLKTGRYWCKLSGADRNTRQGAGIHDDIVDALGLLGKRAAQMTTGSGNPRPVAPQQIKTGLQMVDGRLQTTATLNEMFSDIEDRGWHKNIIRL